MRFMWTRAVCSDNRTSLLCKLCSGYISKSKGANKLCGLSRWLPTKQFGGVTVFAVCSREIQQWSLSWHMQKLPRRVFSNVHRGRGVRCLWSRQIPTRQFRAVVLFVPPGLFQRWSIPINLQELHRRPVSANDWNYGRFVRWRLSPVRLIFLCLSICLACSHTWFFLNSW